MTGALTDPKKLISKISKEKELNVDLIVTIYFFLLLLSYRSTMTFHSRNLCGSDEFFIKMIKWREEECTTTFYPNLMIKRKHFHSICYFLSQNLNIFNSKMKHLSEIAEMVTCNMSIGFKLKGC